MKSKNLILIGPRGVGKSKIAKRIGKLTNLPVISTDSVAAYELGGRSIANYVTEDCGGNWESFRNLEYQILDRLKNAQGIILDCGGGILFDIDSSGQEILSDRKASLLKEIGIIVFLDAEVDSLVEKVMDDPTRPSLSSEKSYRDILKRRLPIYKQISDIRIYMEDMKKSEAARRILDLSQFG
jgi:shikimate kinase